MIGNQLLAKYQENNDAHKDLRNISFGDFPYLIKGFQGDGQYQQNVKIGLSAGQGIGIIKSMPQKAQGITGKADQ